MKGKNFSTKVVIDSKPNKKNPVLQYKDFEFDLKDVKGIADSILPEHTDVVIPGGIFTISNSYVDFKEVYNRFKENKNEA